MTVVMASAGYPESASTGDVIIGTETLDRETDVDVIHAGTALDDEGRLVTAGGRVLAVAAVGVVGRRRPRARPTRAIATIAFDGAQRRTRHRGRAAGCGRGRGRPRRLSTVAT